MSDEARRAPQENPEKDRPEWVTGDEPMTGPQRSYLGTLAQEAGESVPDGLTKAQASELIDEPQAPARRARVDAGPRGRDRPRQAASQDTRQPADSGVDHCGTGRRSSVTDPNRRMVVLESSALVALLVDGGELGDWVAGTVADAVITGPHLLPFETANVARAGSGR